MSLVPNDTQMANPKAQTPMDKANQFKDDVLKVIGRQAYVVNFLIGHIPNSRFVVGPNLESVKIRAELWCKMQRYRFSSVHPFFFDMEKDIRELENIDRGDNDKSFHETGVQI